MSETTHDLTQRAAFALSQLEVHGSKAFPCESCRREGSVGVHELHTQLTDLSAALVQAEQREALAICPRHSLAGIGWCQPCAQELEAAERRIGELCDAHEEAFIRAEAAEAKLVQAEQEKAKGDKARQLIADLLEERSDELDKDACDRCEDCGGLVMCRFHSIISALQGGAWTAPAIERDYMRRRAEAAESTVQALQQEIEGLKQKLEIGEQIEVDLGERLASQEATIRQVEDAMRWTAGITTGDYPGTPYPVSKYIVLQWADTLRAILPSKQTGET
jgi:DNA repair exonuclease SbcCD ATPase subunit